MMWESTNEWIGIITINGQSKQQPSRIGVDEWNELKIENCWKQYKNKIWKD